LQQNRSCSRARRSSVVSRARAGRAAKRNLAALFGHDHGTASDSSVSPIAAPMARAEIAIELRIDRQRQEAGGRRDAILRDDDGAVVQRRLG
jgi:hypothetical protein